MYPVISLFFARIKEEDYISTREKINEILTNLYVKYSFLRNSNVLTDKDREYFDCISINMRESVATSALHQLSDYLYRYYGKKVIILLDEHDTSMLEDYEKGYWANTSSSSLVSRLIKEADSEIKEIFEELMKGKHIWCPVDEQLVYNQLTDNESAIWSLLVASGYLKVVSYEEYSAFDYDEEKLYELTLTNGEVRLMFKSMIQGWFTLVKKTYNEFIKAMLQNDLEAMNVYMNGISLQTFSYFDTGKGVMGPEPERFYHGFVLGLVADLSKEYVITSNRESGFGRYDVMVESRKKDGKAVIMEFKVHNPRKEKTLEETVKSALAQIEQKQYEAVLLDKGFQKEQIYKYGFAFEGKTVLIG